MADDDGGCFFQKGVFEDHLGVGEGGGESSYADSFCFDETVALVKVGNHEVLFCWVVDEGQEALVCFLAVDDFLSFFGGGEASSFSQFQRGDDTHCLGLSDTFVLGELFEAEFGQFSEAVVAIFQHLSCQCHC